MTDALGARWVVGARPRVAGVAAALGYALAPLHARRRSAPRRRRSRRLMPRTWTQESSPPACARATARALARAICLVEDGDPPPHDSSRELYPHTGRALLDRPDRAAGRRQVDASRALVRHVRAPTAPSASSRSTRRARSRTARCSATASGSPSTSSTRASSSARWAPAATSGGSPRRRCRPCCCSTPPARTCFFLETVGTGQSEIEVVGVVDTVVLVLMPGSGDSIQALKAGVMEIPDVIVVNKRDHPMAKTMLNEVRGDPLARPRERVEDADRAHRGAPGEGVASSGRRSRSTAPSSRRAAARGAARGATSAARCSPSPPRGQSATWSVPCRGRPGARAAARRGRRASSTR